MKITPYKFRRYLWVNRETLCLLVPNTNHHGKNWKDHTFLKKKKYITIINMSFLFEKRKKKFFIHINLPLYR